MHTMRTLVFIGLMGVGSGCAKDTGANEFGSSGGDDTLTEADADTDTDTDSDTDTDVDTDTGEAACEWPNGPYGNYVGDTLPPQHWMGFAPGENTARKIELREFFDCDGRLGGLDALLVITSQFNCGSCYAEAEALDQNLKRWENQGHNVQALTLLLDNPDNSMPATIDGVESWRAGFPTRNSYTATDPTYSMVEPDATTIGTPMLVIIDPTTMELVHRHEGYDASYSALVSFLSNQ